MQSLTKRPSQTFCKPIGAHSVINAISKIVSSKSTWNTANQLGKHDFNCGFAFLVGRW